MLGINARACGALLLTVGLATSCSQSTNLRAPGRSGEFPADVVNLFLGEWRSRTVHSNGALYQGGHIESSLFMGTVATTGGAGALAGDYAGFQWDAEAKTIQRMQLKIIRAQADACVPELTEYEVTVDGKSPCELDDGASGTEGEPAAACLRTNRASRIGKVVAVPGGWGSKGNFVPPPAGAEYFTLSCFDGAIAKCLLWGYLPWKSPEMAALHQACVRAVRADYCGTGQSFTCPGTIVDVTDRQAIQPRSAARTATNLEAHWDSNGATCLNVARMPGCDGAEQMTRLKATILKECLRSQHPIVPDGCVDTGRDESPANGPLLRTFSVPSQASCKLSQYYCPSNGSK